MVSFKVDTSRLRKKHRLRWKIVALREADPSDSTRESKSPEVDFE